MVPKNKAKNQLLTRKKVNVFQDKTTAREDKKGKLASAKNREKLLKMKSKNAIFAA
jgi:hypothetical protein